MVFLSQPINETSAANEVEEEEPGSSSIRAESEWDAEGASIKSNSPRFRTIDNVRKISF
jgi:hypothetical protein